ncbi:MAG TPA: hypothetical protein VIN65_06445 [Candidatus Dormibacteraeota bacterium]
MRLRDVTTPCYTTNAPSSRSVAAASSWTVVWEDTADAADFLGMVDRCICRPKCGASCRYRADDSTAVEGGHCSADVLNPRTNSGAHSRASSAGNLHANRGASAPDRAFTFTSETGDYIGQGLTKQFGAPHDTLTVSPEGGGDSASATTSGFTVHVSAADAEYWDITVAPPHGQTLHAGTYSVATRAPFQDGDSAGLDVTGDSRGCNTSFDSFTINQMVTNSAGVISAVDVSFTQHCEGATAPALTGRVQISV